MKTLILVRHGKSSWDHPGHKDFDRPLARRGLKDAPAMAQRLARQQMIPDVIVSSPAKRALHTATIFAEELGIDEDRLITERRIYEASWQELLDVVRGLHDSWAAVMLVGHNPGFTSLAHRLAPGAPANIPTSGCAVITLEVDYWNAVQARRDASLLFDYPKNPDPF